MQEEANYICESCGEEIVVPIDVTEGTYQEHVDLSQLWEIRSLVL